MEILTHLWDVIVPLFAGYAFEKWMSYRKACKTYQSREVFYNQQLELASRYNRLLQSKLPASTPVTQQEIDALYQGMSNGQRSKET